jgi:hypothetical protein
MDMGYSADLISHLTEHTARFEALLPPFYKRLPRASSRSDIASRLLRNSSFE